MSIKNMRRRPKFIAVVARTVAAIRCSPLKKEIVGAEAEMEPPPGF